jgi:hypothetical protein
LFGIDLGQEIHENIWKRQDRLLLRPRRCYADDGTEGDDGDEDDVAGAGGFYAARTVGTKNKKAGTRLAFIDYIC